MPNTALPNFRNVIADARDAVRGQIDAETREAAQRLFGSGVSTERVSLRDMISQSAKPATSGPAMAWISQGVKNDNPEQKRSAGRRI